MKTIKFVSSSLFIMVIAFLFFMESFHAVRTNDKVSVGPGLIPQIIAAALFILAIVDWSTAVSKIKDAEKSFEKMSRESLIKLIISIAIFLFCVVSLEALGCLIAGGIFLAAEFLILTPDKLNKRVIFKTICLAGFITVITYLLFNYVFQVNLPNGFLE
jgi:uncharacterized membrane protein